MALLSASDITAITANIREIVRDDSVATSVIFHLSGITVSDWSPTSQLIPSMYSLSSVSCFKGSYTLDEVDKSNGMIQFGDVRLIFMASDVSGIWSTIDKISEVSSILQSATTYEIRTVSRDPLGICYFCHARAC